MRILFADESGTPPQPNKDYPKYFVVGAIIIPEAVWSRMRDALLGLKVRKGIRGEFKWRYFSPDNDQPSNPMRKLSQDERDEIRTEIYRVITNEKSVRTIASVCSISAAYEIRSVSTPDDIYHLTYKTISERFQYFLQDVQRETGGPPEYGIAVCDHRGSRDDEKLARHHEMLVNSTASNTSKYPNLVESLFFQRSHYSVGIQLADLVAGAVWRKFERNDDRWFNLLEPSFRRSKNGTLDGFGIIKCPKMGWR